MIFSRIFFRLIGVFIGGGGFDDPIFNGDIDGGYGSVSLVFTADSSVGDLGEATGGASYFASFGSRGAGEKLLAPAHLVMSG